ncbi:hypothetical protein [Halomonas cupida]|uniref:hypothetical protein n=1 Tax=Halomonas cupida TaxID=44933 RepID=UPI003A938064
MSRVFTYDIGTRHVPDQLELWEAFAPDLPGFRQVAETEQAALSLARARILDHLLELMASGEEVPVPQRDGYYINKDEYTRKFVMWQFMRVNLGPRRPDEPAVEMVFPDFLENGDILDLD